jgi:hypothetical protein
VGLGGSHRVFWRLFALDLMFGSLALMFAVLVKSELGRTTGSPDWCTIVQLTAIFTLQPNEFTGL